MNNNQMTCDPERIELFLQQQLSDEEQTAFELHLDDCNDCRHRLEATAAGEDIWSGVRDSLLGQQHPADCLPSGDSAVDSATGGDVSFNHNAVLNLLAPTDDDRMLGRLGTYEVVGVIGSGGMGVVLKAFDGALNRYVAIKVLAPHLGSSGTARKRFSREAQAAAAVVHDNVIEIHGVAEADGLPYLVMPYVRGPSLQRRLDDEGPLELVEILRIGMQAASGLAAAHAQGLVHRDVKPANILLADGVERVKLTDFGLARAADDASLTKTGIIAGTPQYMSPEQASGESVGQTSDLFSLGSVLYAMCTGRAPFRAETSYGVLRRITDEEPKLIREINPDIPDWLCQIIAKLMSKQPDDRFESICEVAELLEESLAHVQQPTAVPLPEHRVFEESDQPHRETSGPFLEKLRASARLITPFGVTAAVGFGLLGMFLWLATQPPDIAGDWAGEEWGKVALEQKQPGKYEGTFTDTVTDKPGTFEVKWSRIERRYNGTWKEGRDRHGTISVRVVDGEIRGAWTTSKKSRINPGTPKLADLLWTRIPKPTPSNADQKNFAALVDEFNRLMSQRQYAEAFATAQKAKQIAPDETATYTMELKSRFAEELRKARAQGVNEEELQELSKFPIHRMVDRKGPHIVGPPTPIDVIRALERIPEFNEKSLTGLYEKHADNFRIIVEPHYDKVDHPRHIPGIGRVNLHRVRFKCTVTFTEEDDVKWPVIHNANEEIRKVFLIDADHLHIIETEASKQALGNIDLPTSQPKTTTVNPETKVRIEIRAGGKDSDAQNGFYIASTFWLERIPFDHDLLIREMKAAQTDGNHVTEVVFIPDRKIPDFWMRNLVNKARAAGFVNAQYSGLPPEHADSEEARIRVEIRATGKNIDAKNGFYIASTFWLERTPFDHNLLIRELKAAQADGSRVTGVVLVPDRKIPGFGLRNLVNKLRAAGFVDVEYSVLPPIESANKNALGKKVSPTSKQVPGQSIYNNRLRRFKFRLEKIDVSTAKITEIKDGKKLQTRLAHRSSRAPSVGQSM